MNFSDFEKADIIKYDFPLASVSSMKTGGNAKYAFFPNTKEQLRAVILFLKDAKIRYCVIGYASNVLFSDEGYDGAVVFTSNMKAVYNDSFCSGEIAEACKREFPGKHYVYAEAGVSLTSFSYKMLKAGYAGLEFAYGIPASVGGAIYMNAGAYGGEISQVLAFAEYLDADGSFKLLFNDASKRLFSYRHSPFTNKGDKVIVGGVFALAKANSDEPMLAALENMKSRKTKQPLEYPSCGSAFKRPEGHFAGALIESAGLKGYTVGGACVSEKHAGFIVNKGGAATSDVLAVIKHVQETVFSKYGVMLEPEIRVIE